MRKRFLISLLCALLLLLGSGPAALAAQTDTDPIEAETSAEAEETDETEETEPETLENGEPRLDSAACCVMDQATGVILFSKNMDDRHYPASITKILTALVFLEHVENLDEVITFSDACWEGVDQYDDMNIDMRAGEQLTAEQCLYAMLVASANEVCNQVALYTAGSIEGFADMMNETAARIGCTGSHFVNPNGLHDPDHYVTAHDMARIGREALNNATFRKVTGTPVYTIQKTNLRDEEINLGSKHLILRESDVHDDACIGGKTGWTEDANETLVTFMDKNDITLVCVVLDNAKGTPCRDTLKAVNYCYDQYTRSGIDTTAALQAETEERAETGLAEAETSVPGSELSLAGGDSSPDSGQSGSGQKAVDPALFDRIIPLLLSRAGFLIPAAAGAMLLLSLLLVWIFRKR